MEHAGGEAHNHKDDAVLDYNYIAEGLYLGTNQCCMMGLTDVLKQEGISVDISLENKRLDQPFGVEMYLWLPVEDTAPPTPDQLDFGVATLEQCVQKKKKVYVHCRNGHGRSTTLLAAYFIRQGMALDAVEALVKEQRPSIHFSPAQYSALVSYAARVVKEK